LRAAIEDKRLVAFAKFFAEEQAKGDIKSLTDTDVRM
jgi:hypothetical protein